MLALRNGSKSTLLKQFVTRMLVVLLVVLAISGIVQYFFLDSVISSIIKLEAQKMDTSLQQGVTETNTASSSIEHQIDLRLKLDAQLIAHQLGSTPVSKITNTQLAKLSKADGITGITLIQKKGGGLNFVGVKSNIPSDVNFSFTKFLGKDTKPLTAFNDILHNKKPTNIGITESYADSQTFILAIAPSGSNKSKKPEYFKYGYYHEKGTNYIIDPFIKANEVHHFTQAVGPNTWISNVLKTNHDVDEIAILSPQVFANPSLLKSKLNLLKPVEYGKFTSETEKDKAVVAGMVKNPHEVSYIEKEHGVAYYKIFIPTKNGNVFYVSFKYHVMSAPLMNMSFILIGFSVVSLLSLFILATRFFKGVYRNIQVIIGQIKKLELGDFTARSEVKSKGELADLSTSTNRMAETLSGVLKDTTKQAEKVQNLAKSLKSDTDDSVEKVYSLSIDLTSKARDDNFELSDFLDNLSEASSLIGVESVRQDVLTKIDSIRKMSNNRSESTTDITLTLSDVIKSLQSQSVELSDISSSLFNSMYKFNVE